MGDAGRRVQAAAAAAAAAAGRGAGPEAQEGGRGAGGRAAEGAAGSSPKPTLTAHPTCGECPTPQPSPPQEASGSSSEVASEARAPGTQSLPPGWKKVMSKGGAGRTAAGYSNAKGGGTASSQTIREAWKVHM
eukprot:scaffold133320_cov88-Phaeocystis_antarctica.AAC.3